MQGDKQHLKRFVYQKAYLTIAITEETCIWSSAFQSRISFSGIFWTRFCSAVQPDSPFTPKWWTCPGYLWSFCEHMLNSKNVCESWRAWAKINFCAEYNCISVIPLSKINISTNSWSSSNSRCASSKNTEQNTCKSCLALPFLTVKWSKTHHWHKGMQSVLQ